MASFKHPLPRLAPQLLAFLSIATFASAADPESSETINENGEPVRIIAGFIPKTWPCYLGIGTFGVIAAIQWIHYCRMSKSKYLLNTTIGLTTMSAEFALRIVYVNDPGSIMKYSLQTLVILLSPCLYLAFVYCLLHKLAESLGPRISKECLIMPAGLLVKGFVWCDVVVFLLQASGGGMSASSGSMGTIGKWVSFVGLTFQVVSFGLFTVVLLVFTLRVRRNHPDAWYVDDKIGWSSFSLTSTESVDDFRSLLFVMGICCVCILIRCVFRVVEAWQGYTGYLHHHEGYFYVLDSLPLFLCMSIFCLLWPARCVGAYSEGDSLPLTSNKPYGGHRGSQASFEPVRHFHQAYDHQQPYSQYPPQHKEIDYK